MASHAKPNRKNKHHAFDANTGLTPPASTLFDSLALQSTSAYQPILSQPILSQPRTLPPGTMTCQVIETSRKKLPRQNNYRELKAVTVL
ncbi:hypothetical protein OAE79_02835 [Rhodopirellula sp.]|nr:hypothetical protein [Rhodopirellula sp.]MDB4679254.1 hypothetical protein [Rhodopirellula sp.]